MPSRVMKVVRNLLQVSEIMEIRANAIQESLYIGFDMSVGQIQLKYRFFMHLLYKNSVND
jgi:hypothetical protein